MDRRKNGHHTSTGTDIQETITLLYPDGRIANLQGTAAAANDLHGIICCEKGFIEVDNINNPSSADIYNTDHELLETLTAEGKRTGYEYQVYACEEAIKNGWKESPYMPHAETIAVMKQMDALRAEWGVRFPMD